MKTRFVLVPAFHHVWFTTAAALLVGMFSCSEPMTPARASAALRSPDAEDRRDAADDLRTGDRVPVQAIAPLVEAMRIERVPNVRGAIILTLGRSGAPEAKPVIDYYIQTTIDPDMRRWAARALKYWMIANGELSPDSDMPEDWPYGFPGYPPSLAVPSRRAAMPLPPPPMLKVGPPVGR